MLAPDSRTLLIDQLTPPLGHRLDAAIATTFTLDLTATLLPALAFTGFHLASGLSDPIATLESVRNTANRIDVYCQAGVIDVPEQAPDLLAFLEPMVQPVRAPRRGLFHPKLWFIRFIEDQTGATAHRLLVLTRNLTMDTSWDMAIRLDADHLSDSVRPESLALGEFLRSLPERTVRRTDPTRRQRALELAGEADRIVWERPRHVNEVLLHYLDEGRPLSMDLRGARHLVVSPFVDSGGLEQVSKGPIEILSRAEELEKLDEATVARLRPRVMDELAVAQEVESSRLGGQLHAKMYVVEQSVRWRQSHVFIGSANATGAGLRLNTEFMVELRGHKDQLGVGRFLGDDGDFLAMTEPWEPEGAVEDDLEDTFRRELENAIRRVASVVYTVEVLGEADGPDRAYDLRLRSNAALSLDEGWTATVELLTAPESRTPVRPGTTLDAVVPGVDTGDITPFLAVRVENPLGMKISTVVAAELLKAPDDRLDVVLARQINSPDKFLRFLFFLLSLGGSGTSTGDGGGGGSHGRGGNDFGAGGGGVLEVVLGALATRPSVLAELNALVRRMQATPDGLSSLPEGFVEFWEVVRVAAGFGEVESA